MLSLCLRSTMEGNIADIKPALHGRGFKVCRAILHKLVKLAA
jgi:hypothetical protein